MAVRFPAGAARIIHGGMIDRRGIEQRWEADGSKRDERGRRVFAASEARAAGRGGLAAVSAITGLARSTIGRGLKDLEAPPPPRGRVRREGGGPQPLSERDPTLVADLERLVGPATRGDPERVNVHDFEDKTLGKVVPYGVYDVSANAGFVSVGITSDTAAFAVQSIRCWRERMGRQRYPLAHQLTITADCGGSNGARVRLWKLELQKLADETGLTLNVHHYPPGTSKWNKIEHRLFCHITQNWRGRPLANHVAVVELIGATTTKAGLKVECALDTQTYEKGVKVSDADMASLAITGDAFHPEWNYTIRPRREPKS